MATTAATLIQRTRRQLRDFPDRDTITASASSGTTTLSVADSSIYFTNEYIELDQEAMRVTALPTGTSLTVVRAAKGTTAASHAGSSTILIKPAFYAQEILDALNEGLDACFPRLYRPITGDYTGIGSSTYEYTVPTMSGISVPIPFIYKLEVKESGDIAFREFRYWTIVRDGAPFLKFRRPLSGGTLRIYGYGAFTHLTATTDTLDSFFPVNAENLPVIYAVSSLLASGEAGRARMDSGALDQREQANRPGTSSGISQVYLNRFYTLLERTAMSPMPKAVKSVL